MAQDSPAATNTPVPAECNAKDAQGCTETFVYRPGTRARVWVPLERLYTPAKNNLTQRYRYETDAHGSVVALTDAGGRVVDISVCHHAAAASATAAITPPHSRNYTARGGRTRPLGAKTSRTTWMRWSVSAPASTSR